MGSPMVFHTAPPHPASKARMICSPQLVGGADASQKGLRQGMPAKVVSSVGMVAPKPCGDANACALTVGDGVDHFAAAVSAVSTGEILQIGGLAGRAVDDNAAAFCLHRAVVVEERGVRTLAYGEDDE